MRTKTNPVRSLALGALLREPCTGQQAAEREALNCRWLQNHGVSFASITCFANRKARPLARHRLTRKGKTGPRERAIMEDGTRNGTCVIPRLRPPRRPAACSSLTRSSRNVPFSLLPPARQYALSLSLAPFFSFPSFVRLSRRRSNRAKPSFLPLAAPPTSCRRPLRATPSGRPSNSFLISDI